MSRNTSSNKDPNSATFQFPRSSSLKDPQASFQFVRNHSKGFKAHFSDHKHFLFYSISEASCWHKVTADEHRQLQGVMLGLSFNYGLLEARREKGAQSTNRMLSCSSQTPIAGPLQKQDAEQDDLLSDPVGKSYVLALRSTRHCPINTQAYLSHVMRSRGQRHVC